MCPPKESGRSCGIILEDEQRHHSLLSSMVRRLQEKVEFVESPPTALPVPDGSASSLDADTALTLRGLMRDEHEAAHHLRHIAHQEPHLHGGLYSLLLETLARDSEKHAVILRYLLTRNEDHDS